MVPRSLSFADARARVLAAASPSPPERVELARAAGRALRDTVRAPHALPPFDNSAMDGFAVRSADLAAASDRRPVEMPVVSVLPAGVAETPALVSGTAARIMTGAPLPPGADAVVPFEECERVGALGAAGAERARFTARAAPGANVRRAGADLAARAVALEPGRALTAYDVALLGALGFAHVAVGPRPRARVISTGDELLDVDAPLRAGAIRDSNAVMLRVLLEAAGCEVAGVERAADAPGVVGERIRAALADADVVITIGGVSAGDFDPVKEAIASIDGVELWRVDMKPGRPQAFGVSGGAMFFGLPGNPASVSCVFETLVRPALRRRQGFARIDRPRIRVSAAERIESRRGRTDFVRATLGWRDGAWWARPAGAQVSGHLTPQSRADALLLIAAGRAELAAGDAAPALLLRWPEAENRGNRLTTA